MRAIKTFLFIALLVLPHALPMAHAESVSISLALEPEPLHDQVHAYGSYTFLVSVQNVGVTITPGAPVAPGSSLLCTGKLVVALILRWNGRGGYDFGASTTGYNIDLGSIELNTSVTLPPNGTERTIRLDYRFEKDAYDYGMKPYEAVEVTVKAASYIEVYEASEGPGKPIKGPKLGEASRVLKLLDEMKIMYVEGKLQDMAGELAPLRSIPRLGHVNVGAFLGLLDAMNSSVRGGDYFAALDTYRRYDEDRRADLIGGLVREANISSTRALQIQGLERQLTQLGAELARLVTLHEMELEQLQARYAALSQTYQLKQAELEEAKQSLTTAITAVFLASIAFFFIGRRSASGGFFGPGQAQGG